MAATLGALALGVALLSPVAPASASSGWSSSIPNLSDGTYKCTSTRADANNLSEIQDCTRAVAGGYWQTVTIFRNSSTHNADVGLTIDAIRGGSSVGSVTCIGTIPHHTQVACWGMTRKDPQAWIQAYDWGGTVGSYSGTFDGGAVYMVVVPSSYSPTRQVPR